MTKESLPYAPLRLKTTFPGMLSDISPPSGELNENPDLTLYPLSVIASPCDLYIVHFDALVGVSVLTSGVCAQMCIRLIDSSEITAKNFFITIELIRGYVQLAAR